MSSPERIPMRVDSVTHLAGYYDRMACGLVVYNRGLDAVVKMYVEGADRDVDCMTCLVAEARERRAP